MNLWTKKLSYEMSEKSTKTVASMIIDKNSNTTTSTEKSTTQPIEPTENIPSGNEPLDEETLLANRQKLMSKKKGPAPFKPKVKSPKPEKASKKGKIDTKWDPFVFDNGKGPSEKEAKELNRTVNKPSENGNATDDYDHQFNQFVPDTAAIGTSAGLKEMDADDSDDETLISDMSEN